MASADAVLYLHATPTTDGQPLVWVSVLLASCAVRADKSRSYGPCKCSVNNGHRACARALVSSCA